MAKKQVYFFGSGKAEGNAKMRAFLGGKGANLAEMTNIDIPVPPGFTISTEVCAAYYKSHGKWPKGLDAEVDKNIAKLEKAMFVISARLAPLPPRKAFIFALPSALPEPKKYTCFFAIFKNLLLYHFSVIKS